MGHEVSGGSSEEQVVGTVKKAGSHIVLENVVVKNRQIIVDIPVVKQRVIEEDSTKYNKVDEDTTKYNTINKSTIKYNVEEKETVKYNVKVEDTTKYNVLEVTCEKPVLQPKVYEIPKLVEKKVVVTSAGDVETLQEMLTLARALKKELPNLMELLKDLKEYKLIEQVIKVPKIEYFVTPVERIEWVDVKRERPDADKS